MADDFAAQVKAFAVKCKARQEAIFRESASRVMANANIPEAQGGKMPVDLGFLRNSVAASTAGMPTEASPPELVFSTLKVGESVYAGWTAVYAMRQEYGFVGEDSLGRVYAQSGKGFLRAQVQNWDFIVAEVTKEVEAKIP